MPGKLQPKKRVEFIDLLRGWAVIVMIETHVMNATLTGEIKESDPFQILTFINGLVAPSFLFASGMAYAITTRRKLADYLSFGVPLFRQLGRLLLILLIGYVLHIPKFSYHYLVYEAGERAWQQFFQADVLHCIAVSLLFMQILLILLRTERRLYLAVAVTALAVVTLTPIMWAIDFWTLLPVPIAAYLNGLHDSLFPLFPWSAFLFAGALVGFLYAQAKERSAQAGADGTERPMMNGALWAALGVSVLSFLIEPFLSGLYPVYDYWRVSPSFVLLRLGLVLALLYGLFRFENSRGVSSRSFVSLMGRESLLVYTTHLLLIFGDFGRFNFRQHVNQSFGYPEAILTTAVLLALMYLLALPWSRIKQSSQRLMRVIQLAAVAVFIIVFFFVRL